MLKERLPVHNSKNCTKYIKLAVTNARNRTRKKEVLQSYMQLPQNKLLLNKTYFCADMHRLQVFIHF